MSKLEMFCCLHVQKQYASFYKAQQHRLFGEISQNMNWRYSRQRYRYWTQIKTEISRYLFLQEFCKIFKHAIETQLRFAAMRN